MKSVMRIISIMIILVLMIKSYVPASVVGDSDGAAFVTKVEFEELKDNLEAQLSSYNDSLASKIDGVIADYLSGLKVANKTEVTGLLSNIEKSNSADVIFRYGSGIGKDTTNPFDTNMVNPNISIFAMYAQGWSGYRCMIQNYSHVASTYGYNGNFDEPNNGCYLAGFVEHTIDGNKYYALGDDFNIRKWQFKVAVQGFGENSGQGDAFNTTELCSTLWDFTASRPEGTLYTFNNNTKSIQCAKVCINMPIDSNTYNQSKSGSYYTASAHNKIYGWLVKEYYVYDTTTSKTEEGLQNAWRRYMNPSSSQSKTDKFSYKFNMPKKYEVYFDDLINNSATKVIGKPVYCYAGLPFVNTEKGVYRVSWRLKVKNAGTSNTNKYKIYIANVPFDNKTVSNTELNSKNILHKDSSFQDINKSRVITVDLEDPNKEQTLYFKLEPETQSADVALSVVDEQIVFYTE